MDTTIFLPTDIAGWLLHYGIFLAGVGFVALLFLVILKPFWNWLSGATETHDRLKVLVELQRKALTELEVLNKTLSKPLRKKAPPQPEPDQPLVIDEERKKALLEALARSQSQLKDSE